jgi:hypothetical protein
VIGVFGFNEAGFIVRPAVGNAGKEHYDFFAIVSITEAAHAGYILAFPVHFPDHFPARHQQFIPAVSTDWLMTSTCKNG